MADIEDLWPDLGDMDTITSPKTILAEQAVFLNQKTKNVISAKVETDTSGDGKSFIQNFMLYVPLLNNYSYELFYIVHDITLYPATLVFKGSKVANDETEFKALLKELFSSPDTQRLIKSLYSQAIQ